MLFLDVAGEVVEEITEIATEAATAVGTTLAYNANDLMKLEDESLVGRLIFGLKVTGFGMCVVFVILILLWGILEVFGRVTTSLTKKNISEHVQTADEIPEPTVETTATEINESEDEGALIAVLTAAIIEYNKANETVLAEGEENKSFRIVSFKERNKII